MDTPSVIQLVVFDFDGVFTDNTVYLTQEGVESVRCWRGDGLGLERLRSTGVHVFILSTEKNPVVAARAKKLNIPFRQGIEDKGIAVRDLCLEMGVSAEGTMYVGNDINDISAFKCVGFPVGVADADPEILPYVKMQTQKRGGLGAVREICDLIFESKIKKHK